MLRAFRVRRERFLHADKGPEHYVIKSGSVVLITKWGRLYLNPGKPTPFIISALDLLPL